ncbi:CvpA family protein [Variovorax sp. J22R133]|uniref:CvpA family protein n=1 Tax=Variovorax brevis TaxID=3053503 RepID=UPI002575513C|nr:CvpA family protein [Variovorax sp. J22R133]MDM0111874.1 CvpA family protein [Variovorax sp. J22R133]
MAPLDWFVVIVLGLSMLVGLWRGLLFEVISLAGWVAAFVCAQLFAQDLAAWLPFGESDAIWRYAVAFVLIFVLVAFGIGLVASLVRKLVTVVGLRPVDRVLGAVFGLARGALAVLVVAVVIHLFSLSDRIWWREAYSATVLDTALKNLKPVLPEKLASFLP